MKKVVFILFVLLLALCVPAAASSGRCGDAMAWEFDAATGTLSISGSGEMWDAEAYGKSSDGSVMWTSGRATPWDAVRLEIKSVVIGEGVESIGEYVFCNCQSLESVTLPVSLRRVEMAAFESCYSLAEARFNGRPDEWDCEIEWGNDCLEAPGLTFLGRLEERGVCGEGLFWSYDSQEKQLLILGTGAMYDYEYRTAPWHPLRAGIRSVVVADGASRLGDYAFFELEHDGLFRVPASVQSVGEDALPYCEAVYFMGAAPEMDAGSLAGMVYHRSGAAGWDGERFYGCELKEYRDLALQAFSASPQSFSPSETNKLCIGFSVMSSEGAEYSVTIYDKNGKRIFVKNGEFLIDSYYGWRARPTDTDYIKVFWDGRPLSGNEAGLDVNSFVPAGRYLVETVCASGGKRVSDAAWITVGAPVAAARYGYDEPLVPIFSGDPETDRLAELVLSELELDGLTNAEKVWKVYEWVILNCDREYGGPNEGEHFDMEALAPSVEAAFEDSKALAEAGGADWGEGGHYAAYMMVYRVGSCGDYSTLLACLLNRLGFKCALVSGLFLNNDGTAVGHTWNYMEMNGNHYWLDVRIDHAEYTRRGYPTKFYFLTDDLDEWRASHEWDEEGYAKYGYDELNIANELSLITPKTGSEIGEIVNAVRYTDIVCRINGLPVRSYNIDGYTCVVAEDLRDYGFNVTWSGSTRTLSIARDRKTAIIGGKTDAPAGKSIGDYLMDVLSTDIVTYVNGAPVPSYCINGLTCIDTEYLKPLCAGYDYSNAARELRLSLY